MNLANMTEDEIMQQLQCVTLEYFNSIFIYEINKQYQQQGQEK